MISKIISIPNQGIIKYFKNAARLLLEKGLRILEAFFVGIWLARYLGPENFGILSYSQSFVFLFTAFAALGLDQIVVKYLVKENDKRDEILGTTFILRIIGFIIMFLFLIFVLHLTNNREITNSIILIIGTSILFQSLNGIDFYFQSKVLSKYVVYTNIVVIITIGLIKITLIMIKSNLINFAIVYLIETFLTAIGLLLCYKYNKLSIRKWKYNNIIAKELLRKSWPLIIGSLAAALYMKIDQIMIKEILNEKAVGLYSVSVKLSSIWLFVTVAITQTVFPSLVETRKKSHKLFLQRLQLLYNLLMKIAIIVSILTTFYADFIVLTLFGEEYAESSKILVFYIWSIVFVFLSNGSWSYYLNENLEKFSSVRLIIGAIINIILNIYLIEIYGLLGAAYATLISYSISGYFVNYFFKKTRTNFYLQTYSLINFLNIKTWIKPL